MNVSLQSIILFVRDVQSLKKFYVEKFNLEVLEDTGHEWVLLKAGECSIGLHKIGAHYTALADSNKSESNVKLVFELSGDLKQIRHDLIEQGVILRELKSFKNYDYWICDGEDPEGNVFQLKQKKPGS